MSCFTYHAPNSSLPSGILLAFHFLRYARAGASFRRCSANVVHIRHSRPDYGFDFQVEVFNTLSGFPPRLEAEEGAHRPWTAQLVTVVSGIPPDSRAKRFFEVDSSCQPSIVPLFRGST